MALIAAQYAKAWFLASLRALHTRLLFPGPGDAPTGPLSAEALNTLLVTTEALVGVSVLIAPYEDFFRWRAENLRGYKALYEQFTAALDRRARRSVGCNFVDCSQQMQQQMLEELPLVHGTNTVWRKVRVVVLEREWLRFDRYIVHDILLLFLRTDAWILLGYEARPGTPRGLERYTQAPSPAR